MTPTAMKHNQLIRILVVDDLPHFASQCAQFLTRAGYKVVQAHSVEEARHLFDVMHLHVAILDMRLVATREDDVSGIELAIDSDPSISKIILTAYPDYEQARLALTPRAYGLAPAVAFLGKHEGFKVLQERVADAVDRLGLNLDMLIEWESDLDALAIARIVIRDVDHDFLLDQTMAVLDLFRRIFPRCSSIRIVRIIFERDRRAALEVHALGSGKGQGNFIVVFGSRDVAVEEDRRFRRYSPSPGPAAPALQGVATTTHLGALAYEYPSAQFGRARTFAEAYKYGTEISMQTIIRTLFTETLGAWHTGHPIILENEPDDSLLGDLSEMVAPFNDIVERNGEKLTKVGVQVEASADTWKLKIHNRSMTAPSPAVAFRKAFDGIRYPLAECVPGRLRPETIFILNEGTVLVTDFLNAGAVCWARAYAELECAIRFDLSVQSDIGHLLELEEVFCDTDLLAIASWRGPMAFRKLLKSVATIRHCAAQKIIADAVSYQMELVRQISLRIVSLAERKVHTDEEIDRLAHYVLAVASLARSLDKVEPFRVQQPGICIDTRERTVSIDGTLVELSRQSYDLLLYLYERSGRVCNRDELVGAVFAQTYNPLDKSQTDRLNTAIHRLRERLETDMNNPRFVISVATGYMLNRSAGNLRGLT